MLASHPPLSARDAVHLAVMDIHGIRKVMSFDSGVDVRRDIERLA